MCELHNTDEDTTTSTQMGLSGRKPESLYLSVHYSACLHHLLLVHKLPGYQESLMGMCLTPNQFESVMISVLMSSRALTSSFFKRSLETYRFSSFYPLLCEHTWFLERVEEPWWPWLHTGRGGRETTRILQPHTVDKLAKLHHSSVETRAALVQRGKNRRAKERVKEKESKKERPDLWL